MFWRGVRAAPVQKYPPQHMGLTPRHMPVGSPQGTLYYRYSSGPPALLRVEASMSILLLFSVFLFPKQYEQNHFSKYIVLDICILNKDFRFEQDPLYSVSLLFFVLD